MLNASVANMSNKIFPAVRASVLLRSEHASYNRLYDSSLNFIFIILWSFSLMHTVLCPLQNKVEYDTPLSTIKLNLWLTAPTGITPVSKTYATDRQMAVRRDSMISITLRHEY